MDDENILDRISTLIAREHGLRSARESGELTADAEVAELKAAEVELDQCWDLLRQRRARREYGADPENTSARPPAVVESYWQ